MARQRNNIYAIAADAVDLALDTAGTIGSVVGGIAHMVGIGNSTQEKSEDYEQRQDAAERVATSVRQEAEAAKPRRHKARHVSKTRKKAVGKARTAKTVKSVKKAVSGRASRKVA